MTDSINIYEKYNIDLSRLSRDYLKFPIQKIKGKYNYYPTKEDIEYLYLELNLLNKDIQQIFNIGENTVTYLINLYNLHKFLCFKYEKYNIDLSKLKRNYLNNPLRKINNKIEYPVKEDIEYLYLELNLKRNDLIDLFSINDPMIGKWFHFYNINKPKNLEKENRIKAINKNNDKRKLTWKLKNKEDINNSILKRKHTMHIKYNEREIKEIFNRHNQSLSNTIKNMSKEKLKQWRVNQSKSLKKSYSKLDRDFFIKRQQKIDESLRKNKTANKSKPENRIYETLITKFPNTIRQYRTKEYPFKCDFYIPEINLYIEYQGVVGHFLDSKYKEPFDPKNKIHRKLVKKNYKKSFEIIQYGKHEGERKMRYLAFIQTYCNIDPLKRKVAKENKLSWIEFFNIEGFDKWFKGF